MNLKLVLMQLGNRLVSEHGYGPAWSRELPNTGMISQFTKWLNGTPVAQEILAEMGVEWPTKENPHPEQFKLSAERFAEIEADLGDDESGFLIKSSTLKYVIEREVRRALGQPEI